MKKLFLLGLILIATNAFGQTDKQVSNINKTTQKQIDVVVANNDLSFAEKKDEIARLKNERDAQLAQILTPEAISALKDGINWEKEAAKIQKIENDRLKAEMNAALAAVDRDINENNRQIKELENQIKVIKTQQSNLQLQIKGLNDKKKEIKASYTFK